MQTNEPFWLATGVPFLARVESAIVSGANQWTSLNEPVRFAHQGWSNQAIIAFPNCPADTNSYVFQRDIGSNLGETYTCGNPVNSFILTFDSNPPQRGTPTPGRRRRIHMTAGRRRRTNSATRRGG